MKEVLRTISQDGRLNMMDLDTLLEVALGDIEETEDIRSFRNRGSSRTRQRGDLDDKLSSQGPTRTRQRV